MYDLFIILFYILYSIIISCNYLPRHFLDYYSLLIFYNFSFYWHFLYYFTLFILCYFFLVWHVSNPALTYIMYIRKCIPFIFYPYLTGAPTILLTSLALMATFDEANPELRKDRGVLGVGLKLSIFL